MARANSRPVLDTDSLTLKTKYVLLLLLGVGGVVYHLWFAATYGIEMDLHMILHLGIMMVGISVVSFDPHVTLTNKKTKIVDNYLILPFEALSSSGIAVYLWIHYDRLAHLSIGVYNQYDVFVGALLLLLIIDQSRRAFGKILPLVGIAGIVYAIAGPYFPGLLQHSGLSVRRIITSQTVSLVGVYDTLIQVSATYIVIFIIFAAFLEAYGAMNYFVKIGARVGSYAKSGITQTAVITSIGMGSINGSAAANAATTGAFTIPLMKNQGIDADTSAAIESVASSGGQIMPPIMGAAAFVMAEITGTSYLHIITIGLLPALAFYGTIVVAVHFLTLKEGAGLEQLQQASNGSAKDATGADVQQDKGVEDISLGSAKQPSDISVVGEATDSSVLETFLRGMYLWIPVGVLVYTLVVLQYDPLYAGFFATMAIFPVAFIQELLEADSKQRAIRTFIENTLEGFRLGISNTVPITMAIAVIAIFVGVLGMTGFTQALAQSLISLSGGEMALLLVFSMFAAILFGLGMPTVAAYIVAVLLIAPALANLGVRLETAHFFVFYFAILSAITPPVAIACIITSEISQGSFWRTSLKALALGVPLFILPYAFVVNSSIMYWSFPETAIVFPVLFLGLALLSIASIAYLNGKLDWPIRISLGAIGIGLIFAPLLPVGTAVIRGGLVVAAVVMLALLGVFDAATNKIRQSLS
jgi:TRAP transporter 4TM/12TM fusion protein